jgi:hypothetical protein
MGGHRAKLDRSHNHPPPLSSRPKGSAVEEPPHFFCLFSFVILAQPESPYFVVVCSLFVIPVGNLLLAPVLRREQGVSEGAEKGLIAVPDRNPGAKAP